MFRQVVHDELDLGLGSCWAPMYGQVCTSTRAEVVAMAMALCIPFPVALASDSQAACNRMQRMIARSDALPRAVEVGQSAIIPCEASWGRGSMPNSTDADVWHFIAHALRIRGPGTTSVAKVKAHTKRCDILQGVISERDHRGNTLADLCATRGVLARGPWD
eukprot:841984-Alexandrium_andersonii.AAC.1